MSTGQDDLLNEVNALKEAAPAGFALALHINFTTPRLLLQTYRPDWVKYYSENGLVMSDPTVHWGFENEGTCRWSDMAHRDHDGVLKKAAEHGMKYGLTCALEEDNSRSIGSFAHDSAEFTDEATKSLYQSVNLLHHMTIEPRVMTQTLSSALYDLDVQVQTV